MKLCLFTEKEFDTVVKKIEKRKDAGLDEILTEVWKTRKFDDILFRLRNAVFKQNSIKRYL